ncbi:MAG: flagella accessory protein C [Candidatus Woesearchaeota archaeon]
MALGLFKKDTTVNNAELDKLRAKLNELAGAQAQPTIQNSSSPKPSLSQIQSASQPQSFGNSLSSQNQQRYEYVDIERVEENERVTNLIMQQIKELIEIDNNLNTRIKELENKLGENNTAINTVKSSLDAYTHKMDIIDKNMEKFMGLYEIVTNRFNPFIVEDEQELEFTKPFTNKTASPPSQATQQTTHPEKRLESQIPKESSTIKHSEKSADKPEQKSIPIITDSLEGIQKSEGSILQNQEISQILKETLLKELTNEIAKAVTIQVREAIMANIPYMLNAQVKTAVKEHMQSQDFKTLLQSQISKTDSSVQQKNNDIVTKRRMEKLPTMFHFHLPNGFLIDSRQAFIDGLKIMDENTFRRYINNGKNDLAKWIAIALKEEELARQAAEILDWKEMVDFAEKNL